MSASTSQRVKKRPQPTEIGTITRIGGARFSLLSYVRHEIAASVPRGREPRAIT